MGVRISTHVGQEIRFRLVGRIGLPPGRNELIVELLQLRLGLEQLPVFLYGGLVGGKDEIEDLLRAGGKRELLPAVDDVDVDRRLHRAGDVPVPQEIGEAGEEIFRIVGLGDEVIGAAGQGPDDVFGIGKGGEKDDGGPLEFPVRLDGPAELVAVHARHDDIADHQGGAVAAGGRQTFITVPGHDDPVALARQQVSEIGGLRLAVFYDQDRFRRHNC